MCFLCSQPVDIPEVNYSGFFKRFYWLGKNELKRTFDILPTRFIAGQAIYESPSSLHLTKARVSVRCIHVWLEER